jgi:hypothetical protein
MALFEKLEHALERGMTALDEAIAVARAGRETLEALRPTVLALPELLREAQRLIAEERERLRAQPRM